MFAVSFVLTAQSAVDTLAIVLRQCRKDSLKVWRSCLRPALLGAWFCLMLTGCACYWLGMASRSIYEAIAASVDGHVAEFEAVAALPTAVEPEPEAVAEPVEFAEPVEVWAAAAIAPAPVLSVPKWEGMSRDALRSACQSHGIRWSHAGRDRKHLTVKEMIAALSAVAG